MAYSINTSRTTPVLSIRGRYFGSLEGAAVKQEVRALCDQGETYLVVDLSDARLIDSTGIETLICAWKTMHQVGGDVVLAGMQGRVKAMLTMTRLAGSVFTTYDTVDEACSILAV